MSARAISCTVLARFEGRSRQACRRDLRIALDVPWPYTLHVMHEMLRLVLKVGGRGAPSRGGTNTTYRETLANCDYPLPHEQ